jgi:hypothetical protein
MRTSAPLRPFVSATTTALLLSALLADAASAQIGGRLRDAAGRVAGGIGVEQLIGTNSQPISTALGNARFGRVPAELRRIVQAESQLRNMLANPASSFSEMERIAVLAGSVGVGPGSRDVPQGRWSRHPDGYYVRYLPEGYSYTRTQIWVPARSEAVGREYDPATHIAVPGNTARQRPWKPQARSLHRDPFEKRRYWNVFCPPEAGSPDSRGDRKDDSRRGGTMADREQQGGGQQGNR